MNRYWKLRIAKFFAVAAAVIPFAFCWFWYYADQVHTPFYNRGNWLVIGLFLLLYLVMAKVYDGFRISVSRISERIFSQALAVLISDCIMFLVFWLLIRKFPAIWPGLLALAAQLALETLWAVLSHKWYYWVFPPKKTAIVYDVDYEVDGLIREYGMEKKFDIRRVISIRDCGEDLDFLDGMETVFICGVQSHERNQILKACAARSITVYLLPRIGDVLLSGARKFPLFHLPMLRLDGDLRQSESGTLKRMLDILLGLVMLLITGPIMAIAAIAVKLSDGGPVFYRQTRLTLNGKTFSLVKFRSMRVDAEKDGIARLSTGDRDDRITPVGRVLRKYRIDELPQVFNILQGSMSVVGPRPERPEIARQYEQELPEFRLRLKAKAGLTGYAQVYGKYNTTPYDKLQMDLMYIANPSILEDLRIIFATVKIIFVPESTQGVSEGQTTASKKKSREEDLLASGKK